MSDTSIDIDAIDRAIADIDRRMAAQIDEILHAPELQRLESIWRALAYVIAHVDFRENIRISIWDVDKQTMAEDLARASKLRDSVLYDWLQPPAEYCGGVPRRPMAVVFSAHEFGPDPDDVELLGRLARLGASAGMPFIANASPAFFGSDSFATLPRWDELEAELDKHAAWQALREQEGTRFVALCVPRFLVRAPYPREDVSASVEHYSWGPASFAFATRVAEAFARYRWCASIVGPNAGGALEGTPVVEGRPAVEIALTDRTAHMLSELGFLALGFDEAARRPTFFTASSVQRPRTYASTPEGQAAQVNDRLGCQLPYLFIVARLGTYVRTLLREYSYVDRERLQGMLDEWIQQRVADMDNPHPAVRARRPLRQAALRILDHSDPNIIAYELRVRPHFKYMGRSFTLRLTGEVHG